MKESNIKVADIIEETALYGPPPENVYNNTNTISSTVIESALYGPPPDTTTTMDKVKKGSSIAIVIVLFILGIVALVNKKLQKSSKAIIIGTLLIVGAILLLIFNYFI